MKRDFELLAGVFCEAYEREKDISAALQSVFVVDAVKSKLRNRPLTPGNLSSYRQAQLLFPFVEAVASAHGMTAKELAGRSRIRLITAVRHEAMWVIKQKTKASLPVIGMALGGLDHTTVLSGIRQFDKRLAAEPELRARVLGERAA